MYYDLNDTIAAISSGNIRSAISIIRISGKKTFSILKKIVKIKGSIIPNHMYYSKLIYKKKLYDEIMFCYYKNPISYTGENSAELFCHGNPIILKNILELLISLDCRLAEHGEFSLRAVLNGKMNLLQAESINDIITANSEKTLNAALNIMSENKFQVYISDLKNNIISLLANIETSLEFVEEDIHQDDLEKNIKTLIKNIESDIFTLLEVYNNYSFLKKGIYITLVGEPNVGKSSILNKLLKQKRAIVTDIPGTTRDIISETIYIDDIPITFFDTAGFRKSNNKIESEGIKLMQEQIKKSDFILLVLDNNKKNNLDIIKLLNDKPFLLILNKSDLPTKTNNNNIKKIMNNKNYFNKIKISCLKNKNINLLFENLKKYIQQKTTKSSDLFFINERHYLLLKKVNKELNEIKALFSKNEHYEIISIHITKILEHLSEIIGETTNEDLLSSIFSNFCIGK